MCNISIINWIFQCDDDVFVLCDLGDYNIQVHAWIILILVVLRYLLRAFCSWMTLAVYIVELIYKIYSWCVDKWSVFWPFVVSVSTLHILFHSHSQRAFWYHFWTYLLWLSKTYLSHWKLGSASPILTWHDMMSSSVTILTCSSTSSLPTGSESENGSWEPYQPNAVIFFFFFFLYKIQRKLPVVILIDACFHFFPIIFVVCVCVQNMHPCTYT